MKRRFKVVAALGTGAAAGYLLLLAYLLFRVRPVPMAVIGRRPRRRRLAGAS